MAQIFRRLLPILIPIVLNWFRKRQQRKKLQAQQGAGQTVPTSGQQTGSFGQPLGEDNVSGPLQTGGQ